MSYDITFIPKRPDQSWAEALHATEDQVSAGAEPRPLDAATRERYKQLLCEVQGVIPSAEVTEGPALIELSDAASGIQLSLFATEVSLSTPYWREGKEAAAVVERLQSIARIVERATGWQGYDPQQDRPFLCDTGAATASREIERIAHLAHGTETPSATPRMQPWWRFW